MGCKLTCTKFTSSKRNYIKGLSPSKMTKIFTLNKYRIILKHIFSFFDLKECLFYSELNKNTFDFIKSEKDTEGIRKILTEYNKKKNNLPNDIKHIESCMENLINKKDIKFETVFNFFSYYTFTNLMKNENFQLTNISFNQLFHNILKYFNSVNPKINYKSLTLQHISLGLLFFSEYLSNMLDHHCFRNITYLEISNSKIEDKCLQTIVKFLKKNKNISDLNLNNNNIGNTDLSKNFLIELKSTSLKEVTLNNCKFEYKTIEVLKEIYASHNKLVRIELCDNLFTKEDVKNFFDNFSSKFKNEICISFINSPYYFIIESERGITFRRSKTDEYKIVNPTKYFNMFIEGLKFERITIFNFLHMAEYEYVIENIFNIDTVFYLSVNIDEISQHLLNFLSNIISLDKIKRLFVYESESHSIDKLEKFLKNLKNNKIVNDLCLSLIRSQNNWITVILELLERNQLEFIKIENCQKFKNNNLCHISLLLNANNSLKTLRLINCDYNDTGAEFLLKNLRNHPSITKITLNDNIREDIKEGLKEICQNNKQNTINT